jgi:hypothetical protein
MNRRTTHQTGYVNFPTDRPNTNEGGTFVRLIVREKQETQFDDLWMQCSGGYNQFFMDESYIGTDARGTFVLPDLEGPELIEEWPKAQDEFDRDIFPNYHAPKDGWEKRYGSMGEYLSCPCLAVITLGSTGWTGHNVEGDDSWICTREDLTPEGKAVYDGMVNLYPNCEVLLLTLIDT